MAQGGLACGAALMLTWKYLMRVTAPTGGGWGNSLSHLGPRSLNGTLGTAVQYREDTTGKHVLRLFIGSL